MPSDFRLPRVYPLTDTRLSGLSHAEQVQRLSAGGALLVQLREKHLPALQFYEEARQAMSVAASSGVQLIINDRVDIALAVGAHGVHLGQDDMPPEAARELLGPEAIVGVSTHSVQQAERALTLPVDYLAIGPIFATSSKSDTSPVLGLDGLRAVRRAVGAIQLVAIGGISSATAPEVIKAGADCVALISALLSDPGQITEATERLLRSNWR